MVATAWENVEEEFRRTVLENPFIPTFVNAHTIADPYQRQLAMTRPHAKQIQFLSYFGRECLFGGAAAGGKSDALCMAALQYVHLYPSKSLLVRRTRTMLTEDGGLLSKIRLWFRCLGLSPKLDYHWDGTNYCYTFLKTGATLSFKFFDSDKDKDNLMGPGWDFIGVDEGTQLEGKKYRYLFTRLRKAPNFPAPLRMRVASNPGRVGHEDFKQRFVVPGAKKYFIPSFIKDNPGIDEAEYVKSLVNVDPIERAQMMAGNWDSVEGGRFKKEWFKRFEAALDRNGVLRYYLEGGDPAGVQAHKCQTYLICDPAATAEETSANTAIGTFANTPDGNMVILDVYPEYNEPPDNEESQKLPIDEIVPMIAEICQQAVAVGFPAPEWVGIEDVNGFKALTALAKKHPDIPAVRSVSHEGKKKLTRATPAMYLARGGQVFVPGKMVKSPEGRDVWVTSQERWVDSFLQECSIFTGIEKGEGRDSLVDRVDMFAYAVLVSQAQGLIGLGEIGAPTEDEMRGYRKREDYGGLVGTGRGGRLGGLFGWKR